MACFRLFLEHVLGPYACNPRATDINNSKIRNWTSKSMNKTVYRRTIIEFSSSTSASHRALRNPSTTQPLSSRFGAFFGAGLSIADRRSKESSKLTRMELRR